MTTFGDILQNIGDFGIFQKLIICALSFPNIILGFEFACVFFIQSDPERHCNTDWILKADANLTSDEQLNLTVPREHDGSFSRCRMFVPVDWAIGTIREHGLNETTVCQNGWVYCSSLYTATIVTDFDLVCDRANLLQVAQTVMMSGILLGCLLFGPFAESFGRKRAAQIPLVVVLTFTVTTALCPNYLLYLISQFLMGLGYGGFRLNGIILATEWIGASKRAWGACATQLCGAVGQAILAGLIYFVRDWRTSQLITAALLGAIVIYIWFLPESARWLLERGRTEEAKELILKVAAINKRRFSDSLLEKVLIECCILLHFIQCGEFWLGHIPDAAHIRTDGNTCSSALRLAIGSTGEKNIFHFNNSVWDHLVYVDARVSSREFCCCYGTGHLRTLYNELGCNHMQHLCSRVIPNILSANSFWLGLHCQPGWRSYRSIGQHVGYVPLVHTHHKLQWPHTGQWGSLLPAS
ncbi:solute carrier family 22 member 13 isoform X3 [Vanacampus margaritifer]